MTNYRKFENIEKMRVECDWPATLKFGYGLAKILPMEDTSLFFQ